MVERLAPSVSPRLLKWGRYLQQRQSLREPPARVAGPWQKLFEFRGIGDRYHNLGDTLFDFRSAEPTFRRVES